MINDFQQENQTIIIGEEVIYGESFSFEQLYNEVLDSFKDSARQVNTSGENFDSNEEFEFSDEDFIEMLYFSVCPSSVESLQMINNTIGYLNPVELDKELIQACNPDRIIFKENIEIKENTLPEDLVNFNIKYYYICSKDEAEYFKDKLENFEIIEEFSVLTEDTISRLQLNYNEIMDEYNNSSRGIFSAIAKGIKKAIQAIQSFIFTTYNISGTVYYRILGQKIPAYGIKISSSCFGGRECYTDTNGKFSLGEKSNATGLCSIRLNFENAACQLYNLFNVNASITLKTDWPSKLCNINIENTCDEINAKMSICSDALRRYCDEKKRHSSIPKSIIWTTKDGNGVSSAPCFNYLGAKLMPDIVLTQISADSITTLETFHHEYTHFLHCVYTKNKDYFWDNIFLSETGCTIASKVVDFIDLFFIDDLSTSYVNETYNFKNPYVCFAENLADWYSYVGCYGQGDAGKKINNGYGFGNTFSNATYDNEELFAQLVSNLYSNCTSKKTINEKMRYIADELFEIIDNKDITTFSDFYTAVIEYYPNNKLTIDNIFKNYYKQHGTRPGNVINY